MEAFDWSQILDGWGLFLAVGSLVVVFKAVVGPYWSDTVNRVATLALCLALSVGASYALGAITGEPVYWWQVAQSAVNSVIVAGSLLGVNAVYVSQVRKGY